jgi:hypothetical protein
MSKDKRKPPRRLFKTTDRASRYEHELSPMSRMKRVSEAHEDVLQNIEFVLLHGWREDPSVDDLVAAAALRGAATGREPDDTRAAELYRRLASIRLSRDDVPDAAWNEALRIVTESVERHSSLRPGDVSYLAFAARFIP